LDGEGNIQGLTALLAAIKEEYLEIVDLLIKSGANPNLAENDTGGTPLMYAAKLGYMEIVNLLLNAGADPTIQDIDGETALMKAKKCSKNEVVEILHLYTN
jgi:ankyrin repeat protein